MNNEPFIKQGVVQGETEETPVVTDSDQAVKAAAEVPPPKAGCCGRCGCRRAALDQEAR
jgi:hypothetical protein